MNRNEMYEYLKSVGLYPLMHWHKRGYHIEFVEDDDSDLRIESVKFDWGYIRNACSIHLCTNEIVIEGRLSDLKINVNYRDIDEFEVRMIELE